MELIKYDYLRLKRSPNIFAGAIATHAKNDSVRAFHEHFGFIQSPTDPLHLIHSSSDIAGNDSDYF
jgi:hypothetical protein